MINIDIIDISACLLSMLFLSPETTIATTNASSPHPV